MAPGSPGALRAIALLSSVYDVSVGLMLWLGRDLLVQWFGVVAPTPTIHADLNALFVMTVGLGYLLPYRDPHRYRAYLWLMGPFLKGAGAAVFVLDYVVRGSPPAFLLFALSDGTLALITLVALARTTRTTAAPSR